MTHTYTQKRTMAHCPDDVHNRSEYVCMTYYVARGGGYTICDVPYNTQTHTNKETESHIVLTHDVHI